MVNWIPDNVRFPKPPTWFLSRLWEFDSALVVLPSRSRRAYILARRRNLSNRVPLLVKADNELQKRTRGNDADMLAKHNLVFVDVIKGQNMHGTWSPLIFQDLKDRDIPTQGGAAAYNQKLLIQEKDVKDKKRANWIDDLNHRSKDAYRSLQARTGQRNKRASDSTSRVSNRPLVAPQDSGIVLTDSL